MDVERNSLKREITYVRTNYSNIEWKEILCYLLMVLIMSILFGCNSSSYESLNDKGFQRIEAYKTDEVVLSPGFQYDVLVKGRDNLSGTDQLGFDMSGLLYLAQGDDQGRLWINHELMNPKFVSGYSDDKGRTRKQIEIEVPAVGSTMIQLNRYGDQWSPGKEKLQGLSAKTRMGFAPDIFEGKTARGTVATSVSVATNTKTVLSAESHFEDYYGDLGQSTRGYNPSLMHWETFFREKPAYYGWIVQTDLESGNSVKLTAPGRLKRGGLAVFENTLYYSDNELKGCLFKFVSNSSQNFEQGQIYVADLDNSRWIQVTIENEILQHRFNGDESDMLIRLSEAGQLVGGTPLDNPRGVTVDPKTGRVFFTETYSIPDQQYFGRVVELTENEEGFSWDTIIEGGEEVALSCPALLAFDPTGNLWIGSDIPPALMNKGPYVPFGNNGLFVKPAASQEVYKVASAPVDAEFAGLAFTPDGKFIFASVQHPGSQTKSVANFDFTSHWPGGGVQSFPKSAVIVIGRK